MGAMRSKEKAVELRSCRCGSTLAVEGGSMSSRSDAGRVYSARLAIRRVAMDLAERGLSAETIRDAMSDMATDAIDRAAAYIAEYDREEEDRRCAIDREDAADARDAELERVELDRTVAMVG